MIVDIYRDGGTLSFKAAVFKIMTNSDIDEITMDHRSGELYLGYKSRLLTQEEKLEIAPYINRKLATEIKYLEKIQMDFQTYN